VAAPAQLTIETVAATVDPVLGRTRVDYRVAVGSAPTYGPLILTPAFSPGLSAIAATWLPTGESAPPGATSVSGGPYRLAPAGTVTEPGQTHEFAVVVIYRGTATAPTCAGLNTGLTAQVALSLPADPTDPAAPTTVTDTACTEPVPAVGALTVSGTATLADTDGDGRADAGESIALSYQVVNTGSVNASAVSVDDPLLAARSVPITCVSTALGPDQSTTCSATFVVQAGDLVAPVRFSATASGSVTIDAARPVVISSPAWTASVPVQTPPVQNPPVQTPPGPTVAGSTVNRPVATGAASPTQLAVTGVDLRPAVIGALSVLIGSLLRLSARARPRRGQAGTRAPDVRG
jgi:hypothetical protein